MSKPVSIEDYIKRVVDEAPPLTLGQRDRLALLLRGDDEKSTQRATPTEPESLDDLGMIFRGFSE